MAKAKSSKAKAKPVSSSYQIQRVPSPVGRVSFNIIVRRVERPIRKDLEDELDWICQSFGFFEPIDKEKTAATIFKLLVRAAESGKPLTSSDLAGMVNMSRGSVINHLNNLIQSGLIVKQGRYYYPRSKSIYRLIKEVEDDILSTLQRMERTAHEIDKAFGIEWKD